MLHALQECNMPDQLVQGSASGSPSSQQAPGNGSDGTSGLGPVLREQANKLVDRSKDVGAETAAAVGKAVESAANELQHEIPELASYVRNAANCTHQLADDLRQRSAGDLLSDAVNWGRKQPMIALAGAVVLGFALSRVIKSGVADAGGSGAEGQTP
jgi:hypothetical protein